jgi:hypothetical protein
MMAFDAKLSATDNVLKDQFPKFPDGSNDQILEAWGNLYIRLKKHNQKRNKIAHGSVVNQHWTSSAGPRSDTFFAPFHHSRSTRSLSLKETIEKDGDHRPDERFYAREITAMTKLFVEDSRKLTQLAADVRESLIRSGFLAGHP